MKKKEYVEVLLSHNGVAGLLLYGYVGVGAALQLGLGIPVFNILTMIPFVFVPLLYILKRTNSQKGSP